MKFLVTTPLPTYAGAKVSSCLQFSSPGSDHSVPLTGRETVDVWICDGDEATNDLVSRWLNQAPDVPKSMLVRDAAAIPRLQELLKRHGGEVAEAPRRSSDDSIKTWEEAVLRDAEMLYARARANADTQRVKAKRLSVPAGEATVVLVGAGIMNLMAALLLVGEGYRVRIVDQGPDPRSCQPKDWTSLGVTSGGHNARMFTNTEADNYNEQDSEIYQDMLPIFRKTVREGGWSVKPPKEFSAVENAWVDAFERVPGWMAAAFKKDIHRVNQGSGALWKDLMRARPSLFEDVGFHEDIIRMYVDTTALDASVELNRRLGALLQTPSQKEFLDKYPGFRAAAETGHLAGGITVEGFTVNIHVFVAKLLSHITTLGGEFIWNCAVQGIQRNAQGEVTHLESQQGKLEAHHFVLSPGTTGSALLHGTGCENLVHGVLGIWLQIPNLEPQMRHSIKIHRDGHKVEDINITVAKDGATGEDILVFGGAYGYVGLGRPAPDSAELRALYDELEEVARIYFPAGYAAAKQRGPRAMYPGGRRRLCVRPFTPTGLGVFERAPTAAGGQLVITGGNNTGGFAQAPAVARAIARAFAGEHDPIHILFHPDRGRLPPAPVGLGAEAAAVAGEEEEEEGKEEEEARRPTKTKLLLLCSDGPQHRYLRYRLEQAFPGYRCVQETDAGQIRHLVSKSRLADACWQRYHGLRRQVLGHGRRRAAHFERLIPRDYVARAPDLVVDSVNCGAVWDAAAAWRPDLTLVAGTKYIGGKLMARGGLMVNLHTGHLPAYKGNHGVFFALYDGRPDRVAATLHQLAPALDGGHVLDRVFPAVLPGDTEESLYTRCLELAIDRALEHAERFARGEALQFEPQAAEGTTFRHCDRTPAKELWLWWRLKTAGLPRLAPKQLE